ncbi:hypothetical protein OOZ35_14195 [Mesoflavibacter profundi]|uniref:DUF3601 domain-containing protein n=1 Tax=Mesoflavibacter profundi TaxID=2708110 RepID=A0ABT4S427_9FLAO|nr:hypothetical protein [Mesoflavibacter profundi]MDA0175899.1 hypothetical protein [Mesoflavibacter profundi]MDA0178650.1 hypothetical protein [Mesoflavibacter profundi]
MKFQDLKTTIQKHYPIHREGTEEDFNNGNEFTGRRQLFKKEYYNDYCAVKLKNGYCEIDFFKSDHRSLDKIESDWADYSFSLKIEEKDYVNAERIFSWLV